MMELEIDNNKSRDDFDSKTVSVAKMQAAYICSNPVCRRLTIAPSISDENKVQYIGKVAHITAAAKGGPRYDKDISEIERKSLSNAIFLCSNCADLIDKNNGVDYPKFTLYGWKDEHKRWVLANLNKSLIDNPAVVSYSQSGGINAHTVNINQIDSSNTNNAKQHDIEVFNRSEKKLNNKDWSKICSSLLGDATCKIEDLHRLENVCQFFSKAENGFIDEEIDKLKEDFIRKISPLLNMISKDFDKWPYNQNNENFNIQLKPDYLRDTMYKKMIWEQRKEWDVLFAKMTEYIGDASLSYDLFRKAIKHKLYI